MVRSPSQICKPAFFMGKSLFLMFFFTIFDESPFDISDVHPGTPPRSIMQHPGTEAKDRNVPRYSARFRSVQGATGPPEQDISLIITPLGNITEILLESGPTICCYLRVGMCYSLSLYIYIIYTCVCVISYNVTKQVQTYCTYLTIHYCF